MNSEEYTKVSNEIHSRFSEGLVDCDGKPMDWVFEVREGDGSQGEYHRCDIMATSASEALIKAHRHGFIKSPYDVRITMDIEGDDIGSCVASYVKPIYGDACRWSASATLAITSQNQK